MFLLVCFVVHYCGTIVYTHALQQSRCLSHFSVCVLRETVVG